MNSFSCYPLKGLLNEKPRHAQRLIKKRSVSNTLKNRGYLNRAYVLAAFAVQRERIEGLADFSKIAVKCLSLFT